ncbi:MAG: hypothetical protein HQL50_10070 [Magnetococcales bacterium]|nr:hypothetical protein [Magnetococcales bacterium]
MSNRYAFLSVAGAFLILFGMTRSDAFASSHDQMDRHDHASDHGHAAKHGRTGMNTAPSWTDAPLLMLQGRGRSSKKIRLVNSATDQVTVTGSQRDPDSNQPVRWTVPHLSGTAVTVTPKNGAGSYHWITASHENNGLVETASTAIYFSMPGPAPRAMLNHPKHTLEIVPSPLPREHGHYRSTEQWMFLVRFKGQPLANQPLTFQSQHGPRFTVTSDAHGMTTVAIPDTFADTAASAGKPTVGHGHRRPQAHFVLTTEHQADGTLYRTAFNHHYRPGPFFNKSVATGMGFMVLGMLAASPLLRKPKTKRRAS